MTPQVGLTIKYLQLSPTLVLKVSAHDGCKLPVMSIDLFKESVENDPIVTWSIFDVWKSTRTDTPTYTYISSSFIAECVIEASILGMNIDVSSKNAPLNLDTLISNIQSTIMELRRSGISSSTVSNQKELPDFGN